MNTPNSQIYLIIRREDRVISLLNGSLELNFEIFEKADNSSYANGNDIRFVNLRPVAFFSNLKLTTSGAKHLQDNSHAHIVSLVYKLLTSSRRSDDFSIGFDREHKRRRDELTRNKNIKGNYHLRNMLKDVFGFAEYQEKATYGLGYKLTLTRNKDDPTLDKTAGIADPRIKFDHINWYVPHFTHSIQQHGLLSKQILSKTPTEFRYVERSVFMKEVTDRNQWKFEVDSQKSMNVPIWINIAFQQKDRQNSQHLSNDTFCRLPPVTTAQAVIVTEKYTDAAILSNYNDDDYSQGYAQIGEAFKALTKDDIFQP